MSEITDKLESTFDQLSKAETDSQKIHIWRDLLEHHPKSWAIARACIQQIPLDDTSDALELLSAITKRFKRQTNEACERFSKRLRKEQIEDFLDSVSFNSLSDFCRKTNTSKEVVYNTDILLLGLTRRLVREGHNSESLVIFEKLISQKAINPWTSMSCVEMLLNNQQVREAIALAQLTSIKNPESWAAIRLTGETLIKAENYREALSYFKGLYYLQNNNLGTKWSDRKYAVSRISFLLDGLGYPEEALEKAFEAYNLDSGALSLLISGCIKRNNKILTSSVVHGVYRSSRDIQSTETSWFNAGVQYSNLEHFDAQKLHQATITTLIGLDINNERNAHHLAKNRFIQVGPFDVLGVERIAPRIDHSSHYSNYNTEYLEKFSKYINVALLNTYFSKPIAVDSRSENLVFPRKSDSVELFLPDALFIERARETDAHSKIRKIFSEIVSVIESSGLAVIPRHQFRNGLADPTGAAANVISYHTYSAPGQSEAFTHWHFKESHLSDTYHLETGGYSGWSNITRQRPNVDSASRKERERATDFVETLKQELIAQNESKYQQSPDHSQPIKGRYFVLILQIIDDAVASFAKIKPAVLIDECVTSLKETGATLVIKRHPLCHSALIKESLAEANKQHHVQISSASIHHLFPSAHAIITTNSGAGFEALIHGKAVITVGESDYTHMTEHCADVQTLRDTLNRFAYARKKPQQKPGTNLFLHDYLTEQLINLRGNQSATPQIKSKFSFKNIEESLRICDSLPSYKPSNITTVSNRRYKMIFRMLKNGYRESVDLSWQERDASSIPKGSLKNEAAILRELGRVEEWENIVAKLKESDPLTASVESIKHYSLQNDYKSTQSSIEQALTIDCSCEIAISEFSRWEKRKRFPKEISLQDVNFHKFGDRTLLTVAQYLLRTTQKEKVSPILDILKSRKLSIQSKNILDETEAKFHLENHDFKRAEEALATLRWNNGEEVFNASDLIDEVGQTNEDQNCIFVVTDILFPIGGKGSHERIANLCSKVKEELKIEVYILYYGEISSLEYYNHTKDSDYNWIPLLLLSPSVSLVEIENYPDHYHAECPTRLSDKLSQVFKATVHNLAKTLKPKFIIYEYIWSSPLRIDDVTSILDTHDLQHKRTESLTDNGIEVLFPVTRNEEHKCLQKFDKIVSISEEETPHFKSLVPGTPLYTIPHLPKIVKRTPPRSIRRIGFIGGDQEPNVEGMNWFLRKHWPNLRNQLSLHIYGDCGKAIDRKAIGDSSGVFIHGRVDDLSLAYSECDAFIAPLLSGSGLKIKVVEGISQSRIVFSTPIGAAGITLGELSNPVIFDENTSFNSEFIANIESSYAKRIENGYRWLLDQELESSKTIQEL